jgi:hypothetical protein
VLSVSTGGCAAVISQSKNAEYMQLEKVLNKKISTWSTTEGLGALGKRNESRRKPE